jgi:hypothetical protein
MRKGQVGNMKRRMTKRLALPLNTGPCSMCCPSKCHMLRVFGRQICLSYLACLHCAVTHKLRDKVPTRAQSKLVRTDANLAMLEMCAAGTDGVVAASTDAGSDQLLSPTNACCTSIAKAVSGRCWSRCGVMAAPRSCANMCGTCKFPFTITRRVDWVSSF